MSTLLKFRGIGISKHKSAQFAELFFFLLGEDDQKQKVYTFIKCELHLVKGLRVSILMGNDILTSNSFVLNIRLGHVVMGNYGVKITIRVRQKSLYLKKRLVPEKDGVVPPCFEIMISFLLLSLLDDRDFLFHLIV